MTNSVSRGGSKTRPYDTALRSSSTNHHNRRGLSSATPVTMLTMSARSTALASGTRFNR